MLTRWRRRCGQWPKWPPPPGPAWSWRRRESSPPSSAWPSPAPSSPSRPPPTMHLVSYHPQGSTYICILRPFPPPWSHPPHPLYSKEGGQGEEKRNTSCLVQFAKSRHFSVLMFDVCGRCIAGLVATTRVGANVLGSRGWATVRHAR